MPTTNETTTNFTIDLTASLPKVPLGDDADTATEIATYVLEHTRQFSNDLRAILNERYHEAPVSAEHGFELDTAFNSMTLNWLFDWRKK